MIGPGATCGIAPGGDVGTSGTGRPAALKAAAIARFGSSCVRACLSPSRPSEASSGLLQPPAVSPAFTTARPSVELARRRHSSQFRAAVFRWSLRPTAKSGRCDEWRKFRHRGRRRRERRRFASHRGPERHTMRHAADGKCLDQRLAVGVGPYPARVAAARFFIGESGCKPMDIDPLADDVFGIGGLHDRIGGAVPDRIFGHGPRCLGCRPHAIAERMRGRRLLREHRLERLLDGPRAAIGKSGNDGAAGKNLRIGRQHDRSHGAAGREAGHEHPAPVNAERRNGMLDHLPDRKRLALVARNVARQEPREAILRIVGRLLLRIDDRKAEAIGERRPAGAVVVLLGALAAAVQRDDQWRQARQALGNIDEHAQVAGISAERRQFVQAAGLLRRVPRPTRPAFLRAVSRRLSNLRRRSWSRAIALPKSRISHLYCIAAIIAAMQKWGQ